MIICPNCKNNVDASCDFCPKCGTKIENEVPQNGLYNVSVRDGALRLMNDVHTLYNYFADKFSLIFALKNENENLRKWRSKPRTVFLVLGIVFTVLSVILMCANGNTNAAGAGLMFFVMIAAPFFGLFILFNNKSKKTRENNLVTIQKNEETIVQIFNEIAEEYRQFEVSDYYAFEYFYGEAIDTLTKYLNQFRAESLKDALNLYETEAHQRRLEEQQQQIILTQKEILKRAEQAANAATVGAVFSGVAAYNSVQTKRSINEINSKL